MIKKYNTLVKRRILHVLPDLSICGRSSFVLDLIKVLYGYTHTILILDRPEKTDVTTDATFRSIGADLIYDEKNNNKPEHWSSQFSVAVLYDVNHEFKLPKNLPKVQYAYKKLKPNMDVDYIVAASEYVKNELLKSEYKKEIEDSIDIIYPGVDIRYMRRLGRAEDRNNYLTIGLISGLEENKYPIEIFSEVLNTPIPKARIVLNENRRLDQTKNPLVSLPTLHMATARIIQYADVVIYANHRDYTPNFGRLCVETCAAERMLICENKGYPSSIFTHGKDAFIFDNKKELIDQLTNLANKDKDYIDSIAEAGHQTVYKFDLYNQLHKLNGLLNTLGL